MKLLNASIVIAAVIGLTGCSADPNVRHGQIGGAAIGGVAGGLISDSWGGAAVGAAVGGLVGGELNRPR